MKVNDINIRDPFVLFENGIYYLYGTRAENFGKKTSGFDVYTSKNLIDWSNPVECFNSEKNSLNKDVNWAPEVHKYDGKYYMFATFTKENCLRGTYILCSESPEGPFTLHSNGAVTPYDWECLDGTLYIDKIGNPYLIFCHEHTQIIDGTICYLKLKEDLTQAIGNPVLMFKGSEPYYIDEKPEGDHYVTDGPFMYRSSNGGLFMMWSTSVKGKYAQCIAKSNNDEIDGKFEHLPPLITDDGGHGMIFKNNTQLLLTFHSPNKTNYERPIFKEIADMGDSIRIL